MLEVKAEAKYIRTSAQKTGLVLATIRGKSVADAIATLQFSEKKVAKSVEKVLRSAIANATQEAERVQQRRLDEDDLVVSQAYANQGPSFKRVRPAPMGRAYQTIKRTAHLTVCVAEGEVRGAKKKAPTTAAPAAKRTAKPAKEESK